LTSIADLASPILAFIWEQRVLLGAVGAVVALLGAVVAWRRGWLRVARRHPLRTGALVVAGFAVALPVGWYLISPLFIRTELVEEPVPGVVVGGASPTPAPDMTLAPDSGSPMPGAGSPSPDVPALASRRGQFVGADDFHFGRGTVLLAETAPGEWAIRFEGFSVRNGPDLFVYVSPDPAGYAVGAVEIARLRATDGSFNTPVPAGLDLSNAGSILIWCKQFSTLFAVATLEP
jgi:hypothetical protein